MGLIPLDRLTSSRVFSDLSGAEKLKAYDAWTEQALQEARRRGLSDEALEIVEARLKQQRGEYTGSIITSTRRGVANTRAGIATTRAGVAAYQMNRMLEDETMSPWLRKQVEGQQARVQGDMATQLANAQEQAENAAQLPVSPGMQEFLEAEGFRDSSVALFKNFGPIVANAIFESAPSLAGAFAGGAVAGAPGAVAGSIGPECTASYREALTEFGGRRESIPLPRKG